MGLPPADRPGTPVILHRHLTRFAAAGWTVGYAAREHGLADWTDAPPDWTAFPIPLRRPWWPPHREGLPGSGALRQWLVGGDLARRVQAWRPDIVLTVLAPSDVHVAAAVARRSNCPLAVILHDQVELWEQFRDRPDVQVRVRRELEAVLGHADAVYPVTDDLAAVYGPSVSAKARHLIPIPPSHDASPAEWRNDYTRPHLVITGSLHPFQRPTLEALAGALAPLGGRLTAITHSPHEPFAELVAAHPNLTLRPAFPTSAEARAFCSEHASAILVSYAFDEQPWAATSFPSRLVEGVQLGLPVWLVAPPHAAASTWARSAGWTSHTETLDPGALSAEIAALATPDGWARRADESRRAAEGVFDPETIHAGFEADLLHLIEVHA